MEYIPVEVTPDPAQPVNKVPGKTRQSGKKKQKTVGSAPPKRTSPATRPGAAVARSGDAAAARATGTANAAEPGEAQPAVYGPHRPPDQALRAPVEFLPNKWLVILVLGLVLGLSAMCLIFIAVMLLCHALEPQAAVWVTLTVLLAVGAVSLAFFMKATGGKPFYAIRALLSVLIHPDRANVNWW
ncbi:hypothetical protein [Nocardia sp. NPDC003345]